MVFSKVSFFLGFEKKNPKGNTDLKFLQFFHFWKFLTLFWRKIVNLDFYFFALDAVLQVEEFLILLTKYMGT